MGGWPGRGSLLRVPSASCCPQDLAWREEGKECSHGSTVQGKGLIDAAEHWEALEWRIQPLWLPIPRAFHSLPGWHQLLPKLVRQGMRGGSCSPAQGGDTATGSYKRETAQSASAGFVLSGSEGGTLSPSCGMPQGMVCVYLKDVHKGKKGVRPTHAARLQGAKRCEANEVPFVLSVSKQSRKINYLIS